MQLLTQIIRLLLTMIPNERSMVLREDLHSYGEERWMGDQVPVAD
jgi:hypothetical protein